MTRRLRFLESVAFPALLLAAGLVLLQAHAIPYWQARTGPVLGAVWSLALEAAALALIYRRGIAPRLAGAVLAVVLVSVPLYQVGSPKLQSWQAYSVRRAELIAAKADAPADLAQAIEDIETLKENHRTYVENSKTRLGWLKRIRNGEADIKKKEAEREKLKAIIRAAVPPRVPWWEIAAELLPVLLSLLLFQAANVWSALAISNYRAGISPENGYHTRSFTAAAAGISEISGAPQAKSTPPTAPGDGAQSPAPRKISDFGNSEIAPAAAPGIAEGEGTAISEISPQVYQKSVSVSGGVNPRLDKFTLKRLHELVLAGLARPGINQKEFCARMEIGTSDLSCFLAMFDKTKAGGRRPSRASVARLMEKLMPLGTETEA